MSRLSFDQRTARARRVDAHLGSDHRDHGLRTGQLTAQLPRQVGGQTESEIAAISRSASPVNAAVRSRTEPVSEPNVPNTATSSAEATTITESDVTTRNRWGDDLT